MTSFLLEKKPLLAICMKSHLLRKAADGSSVSESGKVASIGWAEIQATPCFFLFLVLWFTDLFLHMGSIPHLIASFQAVLCFQQYDSFPLNGPLGVSVRWPHICTGTLHMPQNAWHVKCFSLAVCCKINLSPPQGDSDVKRWTKIINKLIWMLWSAQSIYFEAAHRVWSPIWFSLINCLIKALRNQFSRKRRDILSRFSHCRLGRVTFYIKVRKNSKKTKKEIFTFMCV